MPLQISEHLRKTYRDEPIVIDGWTIMLTEDGLKEMIEHCTHSMNRATPQQMDDKARAHCADIIQRYTFFLTLYEKQRNEQRS